MNARVLKPGCGVQPARQSRLKGRQWGFAAVYAAAPRAGLPVRVANAHARFEIEARAALRDWLMV